MDEKVNILVVDDFKENHFVMESILDDQELNIVNAMSGEEALELCRKNSFAVILMDVQMPGMDGFQTAELLRCIEKTKRIPIIFVTAISKEEKSIFKGYEVGAVDYLFKPIDPIILKSKVRIFKELYTQKRQLEKITHDLENKIIELEQTIKEKNQLENISVEDFLTHMYNRRGLDRMLNIHWNNCKRYEMPISFIMLDIDNFKKYNDRYGHPEGDKVLTKVASEIQKSLRRSQDFAGRYGGEEFLAVLPNTPIEGAKMVADRMMKYIENLQIEHPENVEKIITVSMGVSAAIPNDTMTIEYILNRTDEMLYKAKNNGRNQYKHIELPE